MRVMISVKEGVWREVRIAALRGGKTTGVYLMDLHNTKKHEGVSDPVIEQLITIGETADVIQRIHDTGFFKPMPKGGK